MKISQTYCIYYIYIYVCIYIYMYIYIYVCFPLCCMFIPQKPQFFFCPQKNHLSLENASVPTELRRNDPRLQTKSLRILRRKTVEVGSATVTTRIFTPKELTWLAGKSAVSIGNTSSQSGTIFHCQTKDGWKTFSFPFGAPRPIFRGRTCWLRFREGTHIFRFRNPNY